MARPVLPRFETTVLKPGSGGVQVPAAATIEFYWRGATVSDDDAVPGSAQGYPVGVSDPGDIVVGDTVRIWGGTATLTVSGMVGQNQLVLDNPSSSLVLLPAGTRLVSTNRRPLVYADPQGKGTGASSVSTESSTGRASAFLLADRLDYEVKITGEPTRLYVDAAGRMGRSEQAWIDLRDYRGNLQVALDALPDDGGAIFIPRGEWLLPTGVLINKPGVTLFGEGRGSVLKTCSRVTDMITVERPYFRMHDLAVDGGATAGDPNGASCVVVRGLGQSGVLVLGLSFENVRFTGAPKHGLWLREAIVTLVESCDFEDNFGTGAFIETPAYPNQPTGATTTQFIGCRFAGNGDRGAIAINVAELLFQDCLFEENDGGVDSAEYAGNCLEATSCVQIQLVSCVFRNPDAPTSPANLVALGSSVAAIVTGCYFDGGSNSSKRPLGGVVFNTSPLSRISNCTGFRLLNRLAWFDGPSRDGVEYGNCEVEQVAAGAPVRVRADSDNLHHTSLSRRSISIPSIDPTQSVLPGEGQALPGAMLWNEDSGELQTWDGTAWRLIHSSA